MSTLELLVKELRDLESYWKKQSEAYYVFSSSDAADGEYMEAAREKGVARTLLGCAQDIEKILKKFLTPPDRVA